MDFVEISQVIGGNQEDLVGQYDSDLNQLGRCLKTIVTHLTASAPPMTPPPLPYPVVANPATAPPKSSEVKLGACIHFLFNFNGQLFLVKRVRECYNLF